MKGLPMLLKLKLFLKQSALWHENAKFDRILFPEISFYF